MASSGKRKTTMAKLNRERRLRERRVEKEARKAQRRLASAERREFGGLEPGQHDDLPTAGFPGLGGSHDAEPTAEPEDQPANAQPPVAPR